MPLASRAGNAELPGEEEGPGDGAVLGSRVGRPD